MPYNLPHVPYAQGDKAGVVEDMGDDESRWMEEVLTMEDRCMTRIYIEGGIQVIDYSGSALTPCGCGQEAMFHVYIYGSEHALCEKCIASLAKRIIDGLT